MATLADYPLTQLLEKETIYDFDDIATYANGVGADRTRIIKQYASIGYSPFITQMHDLDLVVHLYNFMEND